MKVSEITYLTDDPAKQYAKDISSAATKDELLLILSDWSDLAMDAFKIAKDMSESDFVVFMDGLKKERKGIFAGEEWAKLYSNITMPELMFRTSMTAIHFKVLWGAAFIRLKEVGQQS